MTSHPAAPARPRRSIRALAEALDYRLKCSRQMITFSRELIAESQQRIQNTRGQLRICGPLQERFPGKSTPSQRD